MPSVLAGCLGEKVNLVNAEQVAKEKGISGTCSRESGGESGVTVQFEAEGGGVEVRGTVVGGITVLTAVGGEEVGIFELRGKMVVCEGVKLVEAVQQLPGAMQVSVSCCCFNHCYLNTRGVPFCTGAPCWPLHIGEGGGAPCHIPSWVQGGYSPRLNGTVLVLQRGQISWPCVSLLKYSYIMRVSL